MGLDQTKTFLKKNSALIPAGENVEGVVVAEPKGGAWRRGMRAAGAVTGAVGDVMTSKGQTEPEATGVDVASWPEAPAFWVVLTDKQLHVFGGRMASVKVDPGGAHYPLERVASIKVDKKLMISRLDIAFKDGSSLELGLAKQKIKPFVEAAQARFRD